ncbi:5'-nucleotidase [Bacillus phage vB_BceM-HSE3]|nr:5'-nucleotidase [Bacillus phage vB_BceM-HSE3]
MNSFIKQVTSPLSRMHQIPRYAGVHQEYDENLAVHIADVQMVGYSLILVLNNQYGEDIDKGEFLEKALLHDSEEALSGDFPRSIKYYNESTLDALRYLGGVAMQQLVDSHFEGNQDVYTMWDKCKEGKSGVILKVVDMICVVKKTIIEIEMLNNNYFLKVAYEVREYLNEVKRYLEEKSPYNPAATQYLCALITEAHDEIDRIWESRKDVAIRYGLLDNVFTPKSAE